MRRPDKSPHALEAADSVLESFADIDLYAIIRCVSATRLVWPRQSGPALQMRYADSISASQGVWEIIM